MKKILAIYMIFLTSSCVQYTQVPAGNVAVGSMAINTTTAWNKAPRLPAFKPKSQLWTDNGTSLDSLILIPDVVDGESLFKSLNKGNPMPAFRSDMLAPEIAELVQISLNKYYGESNVDVAISDLAPTKVDGNPGILFNIDFVDPAGFDVKGKAIATVKDEKLYVIIYNAAKLHYFEENEGEVDNIFKSILLSISSIKKATNS